MGQHVLYRILTPKSRIDFGKFNGYLVSDLLKIKQHEYLGFMYYCLPKISFCQELLEQLDIEPIQKPGKDEELFKAWRTARLEAARAGLTDEQKFHGYMKRKRILQSIRNARAARVFEANTYTKGELQAINHGHIK